MAEESRKIGVFRKITILLERGYKYFRFDEDRNYVPFGERTKPNGIGWSKREKLKRKQVESSEEATLYPEEIIAGDVCFCEIREQYAKIIDEIRTISIVEHARNQTYEILFSDITTLKEMISQNMERLEAENRLNDAQSLLKTIESAEEVLQRHYLTGNGDYEYIRAQRALAVEQNRREAEAFAIAKRRLTLKRRPQETSGLLQDKADDSEENR